MQRYFSIEKSGWKGWLVIPQPGKKIPERRPCYRPSERELPKQRSNAFHHKNTRGWCIPYTIASSYGNTLTLPNPVITMCCLL
jgi:hypothetical protein